MSPSFAEAELQKYGWKSGDGLGKERSGIKKAIRVNVKNDTTGLGKDNDRYEFQWWDHIYNKSTSNIVIHKDDGGVKVHSSNESTSMITTTAPSLSSQTDDNSPLYSLFVKSTVEEKDYTLKISDEELFKICEGRTARKGARYDQGGKLERVDEKLLQNPDGINVRKEQTDSEKVDGMDVASSDASGGDFAPLEKKRVSEKKCSSKKRKAVGEEKKRDKTKRVKKSKLDEKEATKEKKRRKKSKSKGASEVLSVADGQIEEPEAPEKKKRKGETSDDKASRKKKKKKEKRKEK